MDSSKKFAITAISDAQSEGFIAASLERQGWQVLYRALTANELSKFLETLEIKEATLFISSDFALNGGNHFRNLYPLINEIRLSEIPKNDHDFSEMIRESSSEKSQDWSTFPSIPIITFTSFGRTVGTSTIALNVASEVATEGARVLLVDANPRSSFLSNYLGIFGVNREVTRTSFGFSIFEARIPEDFAKIEQEIDGYEFLIVDIGEVWQPERTISGVRAEDYPFIWAAHYSTEMIAISCAQDLALNEVRDSLRVIEKLAIKPRISHLINNSRSYSPKELIIQRKRVMDELHIYSTILPRDDRAVLRAKAVSSTLAQSAPKSALRVEIARYCRESNWGLS